LLSYETINACKDTFVGRPLILTQKLNHKHVTPETMERDASGYIERVFFNEKDGWFYCSGIVFNEAAKRAIEKVGLVSCAYEVEDAAKGGTRNNIAYHEEITKFSGQHLAIVDNPRYEGARIVLNSKSKIQPAINMPLPSFKFWTKKPVAAATDAAVNTPPADTAAVVPAVVENSGPSPVDILPESEIEIAPGKKVTLASLVDAHNSRENGLNPDEEVSIDGKAVKVSDLVSAYNSKMIPAEPSVVAPVVVAPAVPEAKKPDHFRILMNAKTVASATVANGAPLATNSQSERLARGVERYARKPATAKK
jgi:hypothetical protein